MTEIPNEPLSKKRASKSTARRVFLDSSTPSSLSIVRTVIITLLILYVADFAKGIISALTQLFFLLILSVFFAYLIDPLVNLIHRPFQERNLSKWMPRPLAIGVAYLAIFSVLGLAISILAPRVAEQAREFATNLPNYAAMFQSRVTELNTRYENYKIPEELQTALSKNISDKMADLGSKIPEFLGGFALSVVSYLPWLILIPILSFFFLKDVGLFRISVLRAVPSGRWRERTGLILEDVNKTMAAYTRAQLLSCLLIGFICTVAFSILGVNYALLLGILAGIFEFIPLLGPLVIAVTTIAVALVSNSPATALYIGIFLIVLRMMQDYVIYPRIVRGGIHLHPLAIILSVLAGEQIAGIPGVFLSVPIVALVSVVYKHVLDHSGKRGLFAELLATEEKEPEKSLIIQDTTNISNIIKP